MTLGLSGARISDPLHGRVLKSGGDADLAAQAEHMILLGTKVCPRVLSIYNDNAYSMTPLREIPTDTPAGLVILETRELLRRRVWSRSPPSGDWTGWLKAVEKRLAGMLPAGPALNFLDALNELYPEPDSEKFCLTHGDPTIANAMRSAGGSLKLIDPIPPRLDAPPLRELDLGCLIQSAVGWERMLDKASRPCPLTASLECALYGESLPDRRRAFFWASYKFLRILSHNRCRRIENWVSTMVYMLLDWSETGGMP